MRKIETKPKQVRIFAILLFILIGFLTFKLTAPFSLVFKIIIFVIEGLVLVASLIKPNFFAPVFKIALIGSSFIGNIIFKIISTLVFYFILTPIALVMRLFGKKFLIHKMNPKLETYYEDYLHHGGIEKQF
jgi:hypothetical protein